MDFAWRSSHSDILLLGTAHEQWFLKVSAFVYFSRMGGFCKFSKNKAKPKRLEITLRTNSYPDSFSYYFLCAPVATALNCLPPLQRESKF